MILAWVVLAMAATAAYSYLKPARYQSTAMISLTASAKNYYSISRNPFLWANENPIAGAAANRNIDLSKEQVSAKFAYNQNVSNFGSISIDVLAAKPGVAKTIADELAKNFVARAKKLDRTTASTRDFIKQLSEARRLLRQRRKVLKAHKKNLLGDRKSLKDQVGRLSPEARNDALTLFLLNNQLNLSAANITSLENQLISLEENYISVRAQLEQRYEAEGQIKILSISGPGKIRNGGPIDIVLAGVATFILVCLGLLVQLYFRA